MVVVQGAIIIGLLFVTFISWIPNHAASYLGDQSDIEGKGLAQSDDCSLLAHLPCNNHHLDIRLSWVSCLL